AEHSRQKRITHWLIPLNGAIRRAAVSGSGLRNPRRTVFFECGYFHFVLEREANVVESFEQAISLDIANLESRRDAVRIRDALLFQIDSELIALAFLCPAP